MLEAFDHGLDGVVPQAECLREYVHLLKISADQTQASGVTPCRMARHAFHGLVWGEVSNYLREVGHEATAELEEPGFLCREVIVWGWQWVFHQFVQRFPEGTFRWHGSQ